MTTTRRGFLGVAATAPAIALARPAQRWKMVTSWPSNSPGPGRSAARLAERITSLSDARLSVEVFGAGELVPALEVFDTVSRGTAELGHTAALFWRGKFAASPFFTAVPFGLTPDEHAAWIYFGGGQALWDELYASSGVKPFLAGNTGMGMGGWFRQAIDSLADLQGLKYRIPGLGGEILRRLGGTPVVIAPGEIFAALETGVVDAAEFVGPWSDLALGLHRAAPYYYWPGFHEPNGSGECLINRQAWSSLPADLQGIVETACMAEASLGLAESQWYNARALQTLVQEHGVTLRQFPDEVLAAVQETAAQVLAEFAEGDDLGRRIYHSFQTARQQAVDWSQVSSEALLTARR